MHALNFTDAIASSVIPILIYLRTGKNKQRCEKIEKINSFLFLKDKSISFRGFEMR